MIDPNDSCVHRPMLRFGELGSMWHQFIHPNISVFFPIFFFCTFDPTRANQVMVCWHALLSGQHPSTARVDVFSVFACAGGLRAQGLRSTIWSTRHQHGSEAGSTFCQVPHLSNWSSGWWRCSRSRFTNQSEILDAERNPGNGTPKKDNEKYPVKATPRSARYCCGLVPMDGTVSGFFRCKVLFSRRQQPTTTTHGVKITIYRTSM